MPAKKAPAKYPTPSKSAFDKEGRKALKKFAAGRKSMQKTVEADVRKDMPYESKARRAVEAGNRVYRSTSGLNNPSYNSGAGSNANDMSARRSGMKRAAATKARAAGAKNMSKRGAKRK